MFNGDYGFTAHPNQVHCHADLLRECHLIWCAMRDPFENVTIGNFLYALGLSIGSRVGVNAPAACINLLQQTHLDKCLGDVMLSFPGIFRLIEFKRFGANLDKELGKLHVLKTALTSQPDLVAVSREVHWYAETAAATPDFKFMARRYLDLRTRDGDALDFAGFVNAVVERALQPEPSCNVALIAEYLDAVATFAGKRDGTSSGMLVGVGSDGGVRYVVVDNIRDVRLTGAQVLQRATERARLAALRPSRERRREQAQTRSRERGGLSR